jgi:hypothetical protein
VRLFRASTVLAMLIILGAILGGGQENFMDQKKMVPLLGNEGPFGPADEHSPQGENLRKMAKPVPIPESTIVGGLAVCVMRDPSFERFSQGLSGADRFLDLRLEGDEWGALFLDVLKCPDTGDVPQLGNETSEEWQERYSLKFQQTIPAYPMLGRIHDLFIYVIYKPEEIKQLRDECLRVQSTTSNEKALAMLKKLVRSCDESSKIGFGLLLAPD